MIEETEGYLKNIKKISEASDQEYWMHCFKAELHQKIRVGRGSNEGAGMWNPMGG